MKGLRFLLLSIFFIISSFFLIHLSKADLKYLSDTPITNLGGINYRNLSDTPITWNSAILYGKNTGKYIVDPGSNGYAIRGYPDSGIPVGYGWATNYMFSGPISAGKWIFSRVVSSNKNDIGYFGVVVYKNCNGVDTKLFSTFNSTKVTDGSGIPKTYTNTYSAPSFDVIGCYLKIENWLNVTSAALSTAANVTIVQGSNTWISFPSVLDIIPPTYSANSTSSTTAGVTVTHSLYWQDNVGLAGYIFSFDNGTGQFVNNSFVSIYGTANWSNATKKITSAGGATIRWCVYAEDTSGNWNGTSCLNPFSYVTVQGPHLVVEKRVKEATIKRNESFTIEVLFHNDGGLPALDISVNDSVPKSVIVTQGDTFWFGQLDSDEGNGFVYTATSTKWGYLKLDSAVASYKDSNGLKYQSSSPPVELYTIDDNNVKSSDYFSNYIDKYYKELQFFAGFIGVSVSIYSFLRLRSRTPRFKKRRYHKLGKGFSKRTNKWEAIKHDFNKIVLDIKDIFDDLKDVFIRLFRRK